MEIREVTCLTCQVHYYPGKPYGTWIPRPLSRIKSWHHLTIVFATVMVHPDLISIPTTVSRRPVYVSAVISYSLAYDGTDVTDNDNLATVLSAQIQISILIGMVRKWTIEQIVLVKRWGITPEKAQKTIQATTKRGIWTMPHPLLLR